MVENLVIEPDVHYHFVLQGVGLKLEDALAFWKSEFSQKVKIWILFCFQ